MNYEEALNEIKKQIAEKGYVYNDFLDICREALEKQIPIKPFLVGDGYVNGKLVYDIWICPCCGKDYEIDYDEHKYCPECGQTLDWEVKE